LISFSASALRRVEECPDSEALDHVNETTEGSERGDSIHHFLYEVPIIGRERALANVPKEHRAFAEAIKLENLPLDPEVYAGEVAFAIDYETGEARELGRGLERNYHDRRPTEIPGTIDVVSILEIERGGVDDFKTGWCFTEPPEVNRQLQFAGYADATINGRTHVIGTLHHLREDGSHFTASAEYGPEQLMAFPAYLQKLVRNVEVAKERRARGEPLDVNPGPWCKYCPAKRKCPVYENALAPFTGAGTALITRENAGQVWEGLRRAKELVKKYEATVKALAEDAAIPLPSGGYLGRRTKMLEKIDWAKAQPLLLRYGSRFFDSLGPEITKAAIERAAATLAKDYNQPAKEIARFILDQLRQSGAIRKEQQIEIAEVKP